MNLKTLSAAVVLAVAPLALSQLNAAAFVGPSGPPGVMRAHHRMRHHAHHRGKRVHSKGPGRCGTHMYYSRKHGHCMDARKK